MPDRGRQSRAQTSVVSRYGLQWESDRFKPRRHVIAYFKGENVELARLAHWEAWLPDVFIGVCDGCAFGGNPPHFYVNRLNTHDLRGAGTRGLRP